MHPMGYCFIWGWDWGQSHNSSFNETKKEGGGVLHYSCPMRELHGCMKLHYLMQLTFFICSLKDEVFVLKRITEETCPWNCLFICQNSCSLRALIFTLSTTFSSSAILSSHNPGSGIFLPFCNLIFDPYTSCQAKSLVQLCFSHM